MEAAIRAHHQAGLYLSTFGDRRELVKVGPLRVMRDALGRKRDPRREDFTIIGVEPKTALRAIREYGPRFWAILVVEPADADHGRLKLEYKANGYRAITSFPFFVLNLKELKPNDSDHSVIRVTTKEQAEAVNEMAGRNQIPLQFLREGDAKIRLYACFSGDEAIGMVRSIRTRKDTAWVSNLFVTRPHRKKGIGFALMHHMLVEDAKYGASNSVLLSTGEGAKLYPRLGYEKIGLMQIFTPVRQS